MLRKKLGGVVGSSAWAIGLAVSWAGEASATTWHVGGFVTFSQYEWGLAASASELDSAGSLLAAHYDDAEAGTTVIGTISASGFGMFFGGAYMLDQYLPASGPAGMLGKSYIDPSTTGSGIFGGHVTALRLNVDFYDANVLSYNAPYPFGDLVLHDLPFPTLNGLTVREFEHLDEIVLSGQPVSISVEDLNALTAQINTAFGLGFVSQFAQDHLNAPVPEPTGSLSLGAGIVGIAVLRRVGRHCSSRAAVSIRPLFARSPSQGGP